MGFAKFTYLSVLFSLSSILQAFDFNSGIYVNHEKWLQYSRALPRNLRSEQVLNSNDPDNLLKENTLPCTDCVPSNSTHNTTEDTETPMSLLSLNLTDIKIPFKIVKDVLRLDAKDENKVKFITEKAVVFAFVNKTVLRGIRDAGKMGSKDNPMIIALFLPVKHCLTECERNPLAGAPKTPTFPTTEGNVGGKDSEWPRFVETLLTEMTTANVTSQNLLNALLDSKEEETPTQSNAGTDPSTGQTSHSEVVKLIKDHDFQDSDVMLYFFKTPHVGIPPEYVERVLKEIDIPLVSSSHSKFEVNEVYLMTVTNETAGKELKETLQSEKWSSSHAPNSTAIVLSFIIPIEFNSERKGRSFLPRAKLMKSPLRFFTDFPPPVNDLTPIHRSLVYPAPALLHLLPIVPITPLKLDQNEMPPQLIAFLSKQYSKNVNDDSGGHSTGYFQTNYGKAEGHVSLPQENQQSSVAAPPVGPLEQLNAPPVTAPGGITSSLQP